MTGRVRDPLEKILSGSARVARPPHPAALPDDEILAACDWGRTRGSGPGGQHRNKVETTVELVHRATGAEAHAGERRSVTENKRVALRRLRLRLATEHREPVPAGDIRSDLWRARTPKGKLVINPGHRDYASLLAEALDVVAACGWDVKRASVRLEVTASQLVKLIKQHPPAFGLLNEKRKAGGERPLS